MNLADAHTDVDISRRRSLPPGAAWRLWRAPDGWPIRTVHWAGAAGRPAILFANGRADFIEKYSETYWRWRDSGYGVMTFDWRGQGLSGRFPAGRRGYFETWLEDFRGLADDAARVLQAPLIAAGHSMGGHLALRHLARHGGQKQFSRAVLFAPMAGIAAGGAPRLLLRLAARTQLALGRGEAYPPSQGPYGARQRSTARQLLLTSDAARFADEAWWIDRTPELATGGATWRWIAEAIASCAELARPGTPEAIDTPVDIYMGTNERLISAGAARAIAERLPHVTWRDVEGGAHELLRERPEIQAWLQSRFDAVVGAAR